MPLSNRKTRSDTVFATSFPLYEVRSPVWVERSTKLLLALMIAAAASLLFVPWVQTSPAAGQVIAYAPQEREQIIEAPIKGIVRDWHVIEGQVVQEGDLIAEMADNDPDYALRLGEQRDAAAADRDAVAASIEDLGEQRANLVKSRDLALESYDAKIQMTRYELEAARENLIGAQQQLDAAEKNLERIRGLAQKGLSSERDLDLAQAKAAKARADVAKAKATISEYQSKILSLQADRAAKAADADAKISEIDAKIQDARSKRAKAEANLSKAETTLARQRRMEIRAPRAGTILNVLARQGTETVKEGDALATLIPTTDSRAVELYVEGNDVALVWPGRKVRVQFEGWPAIQFSGWPAASVGTFAGVVSFVDARATPEGRFRVVAIPDPDEGEWPEPERLRQGTRAAGWILLDTVALGYELWRQLNGFPPELNYPTKDEMGTPKPSKKSEKKD